MSELKIEVGKPYARHISKDIEYVMTWNSTRSDD